MAQAETVENLEMNLKQFGFYDYVVFAIMLAVCLLIGIYYAFSGGKSKRNVEEYLMGGRKMPTFPVAASLVARYLILISSIIRF